LRKFFLFNSTSSIVESCCAELSERSNGQPVTGVFAPDGTSRLMEVRYFPWMFNTDSLEKVWAAIGKEVGQLILAVEKETGRELSSFSVDVKNDLKAPLLGHLSVSLRSAHPR